MDPTRHTGKCYSKRLGSRLEKSTVKTLVEFIVNEKLTQLMDYDIDSPVNFEWTSVG